MMHYMYCRKPRTNVLLLIFLALCAASLFLMLLCYFESVRYSEKHRQPAPWTRDDKYVEVADADDRTKVRKYRYNREMPIVFIGGMPRSGTTLLRVILDAHPDIRCGGETRVIPRLLSMRHSWFQSAYESRRLVEAGIGPDVFDHAVAEFMLEIIVRHGPPAKRLCNKDPFTLKSAVYLRSLFPNARFLFMIRDGRAVAHSIVSRKVTIGGFNITNYRDCIYKWNEAMAAMHAQCETLGPSACLPVYYEQLVLHPETVIRSIMTFLNLPWSDKVMHHNELINNHDDEITLSKLERSTDQVVKPVNTETLATWVGELPADVVDDMPELAPMLAKLGYDPYANPPNYGTPDAIVVANMQNIEAHKEEWREKEAALIKQREEMKRRLLAMSKRKAAAKSSASSSSASSVSSFESASELAPPPSSVSAMMRR